LPEAPEFEQILKQTIRASSGKVLDRVATRGYHPDLQAATISTLVIGLALCIGMHFSSVAWPLLARLASQARC
jgi:hypothetical protein